MENTEILQILYFKVYITVYSEHNREKDLDKNEESKLQKQLLIGNNWTGKILYLPFYDTTVKKAMLTGLEKLLISPFLQLVK